MPKTATATPPAVRWRALRSDGIAHAFVKGRGRALCGEAGQDERFDHPRQHKCQLCAKTVSGAD